MVRLCGIKLNISLKMNKLTVIKKANQRIRFFYYAKSMVMPATFVFNDQSDHPRHAHDHEQVLRRLLHARSGCFL